MPMTSEQGRRFGIFLRKLGGDRGLMTILPSSAFSYSRGAPLDNVPRGGQACVGECLYFQLRLLLMALIQRPAELALSFPRP
jgi:hypothetical protein